MGSGDSTNHQDPTSARAEVRAPRLAGLVFSEDSVTNAMRTLFLREIESATPEVLEKLRSDVWPQYVEAYHAAQQDRLPSSSSFQWPPELRQAVKGWAREVRLLKGDGPPNWVLQQVETTLQVWTRNPDLVANGARWLILGGNKWEQRRPQDYLIELPQFTWYWLHGSESKQEARKRILDAVATIVDARLAEMEKAITELPRVPTKSKPEHFTWTVLNQIRGVPLKDLAEQDGIAFATVKNAVMALKAQLGISLPKGRPKKK